MNYCALCKNKFSEGQSYYSNGSHTLCSKKCLRLLYLKKKELALDYKLIDPQQDKKDINEIARCSCNCHE